MFEKLAIHYYNEEQMSDALYNQIQECYHRAEAFMTKEAKYIINTTHLFHDFYLSECSIYCDHGSKKCRIALSNKREVYTILLYGVCSLSIVGELVSDKAEYPKSEQGFAFAQVLALWLDYQAFFDICLLLDNERYIIIRANEFSIIK